MKDRRTAPRYNLSLPVLVSTPNEQGGVTQTGKTRDISTRGVYFTIDGYFNSGTELDLKMTLPAEATGGIEVFIRASGKVVRVDKRTGMDHPRSGVAVVIVLHEIIRNENGVYAKRRTS